MGNGSLFRLREMASRLFGFLRPGRLERDMDDEIASHLEMAAAEYEQRGLDPAAARRAARRDFGAVEGVRETYREQRGLPRLESWLQDLRLAVRALGRSPGFALVAVLTVALGIGVNGAVFSLVDAVLLQPLPYPQPERLVRVFESSPSQPRFPVSPGNFRDYRDGTPSLESLAIYTRQDLLLTERERPERLAALRVSPSYFPVLGGELRYGRNFTEGEMTDGSRVVILSHAFYQRRFGGDPSVVGRTLRLDSEAFTVVGVMERGFQHAGGDYRTTGHGETVDVWWPVDLRAEQAPRHWHFMNAVGRLAPGASRADAEADLNRVADDLAVRFPDSNEGWRLVVTPLKDEIVGSGGRHALLLLAAVVPLLLIACANVASLCLARAAARRSEVAVRTALGAGRGRIVRHMLTENVLVALLGGAVGTALAWGGMELLKMALPADFPRLQAVSMHGGVVLFLLALTALTALLAGLAPALQGSRCEPAAALHDGGGAGSDRRTLRLRGALVVVEVTLAAALLVGGGLLLRSFQTLLDAGAGFEPRGVLTFSLSLPGSTYGEQQQRADFVADYVGRLRTLPGVTAVGAATDLPWSGWDENSGFGIVGDTTERERGPSGRFHVATPGYFEAAGWPLLAGRAFTAADRAEAPLVLLVNESLARTYLADPQAALGRRLDLWGGEREIVGVVANVADRPGDAHTPPALYFPQGQMPFSNLSVTVRADGEPLLLAPAARRELAALDPELPLADVRTLDDVVAAAYAERRLLMLLTNLFAVLAVLLFAVGAYGVLAYSVQQRRRELAIRMALGAPGRAVVGLVVGQGLRLAAVGLALGIALALLFGEAVSGFLYGVSPRDPATLAAAALLTLAVAAAASLAPAWRATRTDPVRSLRAD